MKIERKEDPICISVCENEAQLKYAKNPIQTTDIGNNLEFKNNFLTGTDSAKGTIKGLKADFKLSTNFWGNQAKLIGKINNIDVRLTLKGEELKGNLPKELQPIAAEIKTLLADKIRRDLQRENRIATEVFIHNAYCNY